MASHLWLLRGLVILFSFLYELPSISMNHGLMEKGLDITNDAAQYLSKSLQSLFKNCSEMDSYIGISINEEAVFEDDLFNYECLTVEKVIRKHLEKNVSLHVGTEGACLSAMRDLKNEMCYKKEEKPQEKPAYFDVWIYSLASVSLINFCSVLGFVMFPFMRKKFFRHLITTLTGLAASSLLGSALFHMIPQAYGLVGSAEQDEYLNQSVYVGLGIWTFLMVERFLKIADDFWKRRQALRSLRANFLDGLATVSNQAGTALPLNELHETPQEDDDDDNNDDEQMQETKLEDSSSSIFDIFHKEEDSEIINPNGHGHSETKKKKGVKTIVWMITLGDSLHNLIDGLTIGAAFSNSLLTGFSISVGVLCEEFPHELGDYALLLNSGLNRTQATCYNFIAAISCYVGMALGIVLGDMQSNSIFAFAGGMFIYIALVDMIGEVNETIKEDSKISVARALYTLLLQNIGMAAGGISLYLLALHQDKLKFD